MLVIVPALRWPRPLGGPCGLSPRVWGSQASVVNATGTIVLLPVLRVLAVLHLTVTLCWFPPTTNGSIPTTNAGTSKATS